MALSRGPDRTIDTIHIYVAGGNTAAAAQSNVVKPTHKNRRRTWRALQRCNVGIHYPLATRCAVGRGVRKALKQQLMRQFPGCTAKESEKEEKKNSYSNN